MICRIPHLGLIIQEMLKETTQIEILPESLLDNEPGKLHQREFNPRLPRKTKQIAHNPYKNKLGIRPKAKTRQVNKISIYIKHQSFEFRAENLNVKFKWALSFSNSNTKIAYNIISCKTEKSTKKQKVPRNYMIKRINNYINMNDISHCINQIKENPRVGSTKRSIVFVIKERKQNLRGN